ncbi:hypothetical protein C4D60_Mb07t03280 [Musa balbisiana]|uniref:Uncharacterized protein n=1 Tax=Musa balbisiana TaxID=52838 RepID=A0A4S8JCU2_MUSBA|nr:hypothetical protein C4D60_Mb07t03280 [Musa balbisiana]
MPQSHFIPGGVAAIFEVFSCSDSIPVCARACLRLPLAALSQKTSSNDTVKPGSATPPILRLIQRSSAMEDTRNDEIQNGIYRVLRNGRMTSLSTYNSLKGPTPSHCRSRPGLHDTKRYIISYMKPKDSINVFNNSSFYHFLCSATSFLSGLEKEDNSSLL